MNSRGFSFALQLLHLNNQFALPVVFKSLGVL
jgi:hypothetical protein